MSTYEPTDEASVPPRSDASLEPWDDGVPLPTEEEKIEELRAAGWVESLREVRRGGGQLEAVSHWRHPALRMDPMATGDAHRYIDASRRAATRRVEQDSSSPEPSYDGSDPWNDPEE